MKAKIQLWFYGVCSTHGTKLRGIIPFRYCTLCRSKKNSKKWAKTWAKVEARNARAAEIFATHDNAERTPR